MQKFIKLQSLKRFKHFLCHFLQFFDVIFIVNFQVFFSDQDVLLLDALLLFLNEGGEDARLIIFTFNPFIPQVDHRPQLAYDSTRACTFLSISDIC